MTDSDSQHYHLEINNLKETINALRDALEKQQMEVERQLQTSRQASNEQIKQLEETIDQMRLRLEKEYSSRESHVQVVTQSLNDQLQQA